VGGPCNHNLAIRELGYEVEYFFGSGQDLVVSASSLFESVGDGNPQTSLVEIIMI
jgi:hypothetical protein